MFWLKIFIFQIILQSLNFSFITYIQLSNNIKLIQIHKKVGTRNLLLINWTDFLTINLWFIEINEDEKNASYSKPLQRTHFHSMLVLFFY